MSHLTQIQRYQILVYKEAGKTNAEIARLIGKDATSIGREMRRNGTRSGDYHPDEAQQQYQSRLHSKPKRKAFTAEIRGYVEEKLALKWSPEQISMRGRDDGHTVPSHEAIYQYVYRDKQQGGELYMHLRNRGRRYRRRLGTNDRRGAIPDRVGIDQRPAEVADRLRFGDLEIGTVVGKDHQGGLLTINDRCTGRLWIRLLRKRVAAEVAAAALEALGSLKGQLHTITSDNGKEFAEHKVMARELNISFYFADPGCSWQRGANENANRLIRQFFPKRTDFSSVTKEEVEYAEMLLNNRPRKRLAYKTPIEKFKEVLTHAFIS